MKKIYETEASFKYALAIMAILAALLSYGLGQTITYSSTESMIFLFMPYLFIIISLTLCWDIIAEEGKKHKFFGVLLFLASIVLAWRVFSVLGLPASLS